MAKARQANLAHFYFFCGTLPTETFEVLSFSGTDGISMPYQFSLLLLAASDSLSPEDVVNKPGSLYIYRDDEFFPYTGIVTEFRYAGRQSGKAAYVLKLQPRLWLLSLNKQTRVFQKKSVTTIVKEVLDKAGLKNGYSLKVTESNYPEQEYVVQYQESDLNFISRLMEANGLYYFFTENPILLEELGDESSKESLLITDAASSFAFVDSMSDVLFRGVSGMTEQEEADARESISNMQLNRQMVPKEVVLKDYNYRTPEVDLKGQKPVTDGDAGTVYEYGAHFKDTSGAQRRAQVEAERLQCRRIQIDGAGNCRGFRAGKRFTLQEHYRDDLNGKYLITRVAHQGAHTSSPEAGSKFTYANRFTCIPAAQADKYRPPLRAIVPRINGIFTAKIEANGSDYAALDDMGRYKVRMNYDIGNASNYEASQYIRLASPYSGSGYGLHFPSHENAEMVLACVDGDPDRPLGLGTVPNANMLPPVVSSNKEKNVILTAGGNLLELDDTDQKQKITVSSKGAHILQMDDDKKTVNLQSTAKNALFIDDQNNVVTLNADKFTIEMNYKGGKEGITISTKNGNVIKLDDNGKKIQIQSKAGHGIEMDDNGKKITVKDCAGKNTVTLDGNGGLNLKSQGKIAIEAQQDLEIKAMNVKITANAAFEAKATSDLKLKGMNAEVKGDMGVKVNAGMNLELKGGMQAKLDGMMTDVNGSAMTKIKGGIVMIN